MAASGFPVWYELMSRDPAGVAPFYRALFGWEIPAEGTQAANGPDYRLIERADGGHAGGLLTLTPAMCAMGMAPVWLPYFHAGDVDALADSAAEHGAAVPLPPTDMPMAGRVAMIADPQGAHFYAIAPEPPAGQPDARSDVFDPATPGRCAWNELNTDGASGQEAFYTALFDWSMDGEMPMPDGHSYRFLACRGEGIGAIGSMKPDNAPSMWLPYFRVADIAAAEKDVTDAGGRIVMGPHEVPGGDRIIVASDPDGAMVGIVGRKED